MKLSAMVKKRDDAKGAATMVMEAAAQVYRAAMADVLSARPEEEFHDALNRVIDERIAYNRWYYRLWRRVIQ